MLLDNSRHLCLVLPRYAWFEFENHATLNPKCSPIKQKLRIIKPEMPLKIKEEVKKKFDVGFLAVARYLEWVADIVSIPKKDGKL